MTNHKTGHSHNDRESIKRDKSRQKRHKQRFKQRFKQLPVHVKKKVRVVTGLLGSVNVAVDISKTTNSCYLTVCGLFVVRISDHPLGFRPPGSVKPALCYATKRVLTEARLVDDLLGVVK